MKKNCPSMMPTNLFVAHHHRRLLLLFLSQQKRRRRPSRRRGSSSSSPPPPSRPCRRLSFAEMTTRERETSQTGKKVWCNLYLGFSFFVATLNQVSEKTGREREKERQKARAQTSGHALSTKKNGRRVRAFDRRGERLCAVTFLIPLFFLLLFCVRRRRGESVFKLRRVSDPSFVRFFFPRTKFY